MKNKSFLKSGLPALVASFTICFTTSSAWAATINVPADQPTIQAAINAASAGDTVSVAAGTYSEGTITLNKSLTMLGANSGKPGIGVRADETLLKDTNIVVSADDLEINGFKFTGAAPGSAVIDAFSQAASRVVVRDNVIEKVANNGIYLNGGGTRQDWTIDNNYFHGIGQISGVAGTSNFSAINLWMSNGMIVSNNVIDIVDYNGLNLDTVVSATVSGNTFANIGKTGIQVANACVGPITIESNSFVSCNSRYPLDQQYYYSAVKLYSGAATLTTSGDITIRNNQLCDSVVGFLMARPLNAATHVLFENNVMTGNSLAGFLQYQPAGEPIMLSNNYWGSASGPATGQFTFPVPVGQTPEQARQITGGGSGDAILTNIGGSTVVDASRWLAAVPGTSPMTWGTRGSIQAAIDSASAGDVIAVYPGTYNETATGRGALTDTGSYQYGLFLPPSKPGLTLQGVKADGTPVTHTSDVAATVTTSTPLNKS